MNSIRKIDAWAALDDTMHKTERGALLASIAFILDRHRAERASGLAALHPPTFDSAHLMTLVDALPALMPLFTRLLDPRNMKLEPKPLARDWSQLEEEIDTRHIGDEVTGDDLRDIEPEPVCRRCGEAEHEDDECPPPSIECMHCGGRHHMNEPCHPMQDEGDALVTEAGLPAIELEIDDLRVGQLVEAKGANGEPFKLVIDAITADNHPEPVIIGTVLTQEGLNADLPQCHGHLEDIIRVLKQPEDMMSLEEAREALEQMANAEVDYKDGSAVARQHKQRILLHRRIEQLENEDAS